MKMLAFIKYIVKNRAEKQCLAMQGLLSAMYRLILLLTVELICYKLIAISMKGKARNLWRF